MNLQNSGGCRRENAHVRHRPALCAIAHWDRTIQYSATPAMEPKGRGVLDTRFHGYDGGGWSSVINVIASQRVRPSGGPI
jgi:hypothetical protein